MKPEFKPTPEQITACTKLVIAMAFEQIATQAFNEIEAEVLKERNYHYDDKYFNPENAKFRGRLEFPDDRIITDSSGTCHMAGLDELNTDQYTGTDADIFYKEIRKKALNKGFVNGENFSCILENNRHKFENAFIALTDNIHHLKDANLYGENRKQLLNLTLNLFVPLIDTQEKEKLQLEYYREHNKIGLLVKDEVNELLNSL